MQDDLAGLWPVSSIIAECKAQARQTLDPGFTRFMNAAATAIEAAAAITALRGEVEAARLSERARIVAFLRKHPGDHARVFAKAVDDGEHTPIG